MGILSGPQIQFEVERGTIVIDPFDPARLGPNSYDVRLGPTLLEIEDALMDITEAPKKLRTHTIPDYGFILRPGCGYLGHIVEKIRCDGFVPWIDGRSTMGRYFVQTHQTAGRGDDGWGPAQFTLEILATSQPVRIYAGVAIAQVTFFQLIGPRAPYQGRYQGQMGPTPPKPLPRG